MENSNRDNKIVTVNDLFAKSDIQELVDSINKDNIRFVIVMCINKDGSTYTNYAGFVSELELRGSKEVLVEYVDNTINEIFCKDDDSDE